MSEIFRIVTARNTTFTLGEPYDTSLNPPTLFEISWSPEDGWYVAFTNHVKVLIHDPVEFWKRVKTK